MALCGRRRKIGRDTNGKPFVHGSPDLHISISHSRNTLAAAATSLGPIGLDVEHHKISRDIVGIAEAAFGPQEREAVRYGGLSAFYRIWSLREAIGKATGEGLQLVMDGQDHVPPSMPDDILVRNGKNRLLGHRLIGADLSIALAISPSV